MEIPISTTLLKDFKATKTFKDNQKPITSICFNDTGDLCVTSAQDESLNVYDCKDGEKRSTLFSKKYGVNLARFTHASSNVVYASTKEDDTLRYLSLHDNKYIRYFRGHKQRVVSLEMSPLDDSLLSASLDNTVRLWDLRSSACQGVVTTTGRPTAAFDPAGLVFAVGTNSGTVKVYDLRNYESGPFATWNLRDDYYYPDGIPDWTGLKFSNTGKSILISTVGQTNYLIDAFEGHVKQRLSGHSRLLETSYGEEAGFAPDGRFVFAGGRDGDLHIWDLENPANVAGPIHDNRPMCTLTTPHAGNIRAVGFNPQYMMMVTASDDLAFWEPKSALDLAR
ncbi:WD repeat domain 82-like protein [Zychaea mexicana]|uniref:WD repeat domain 82-like protein n=1 Tax=Zychaea mexicana TaxID=64656 RepID=UPI0022FDD04A|nr:WD repeat domain 82-like protein [Zychaea mexicana]KAI9499599.1 WD repeat domain 82-like protein [Zychaea mexicana]